MSKKIKILHLIPRFERGGAETLVLQYAHLMNSADFEIAVASCVEDGPMRADFERAGVRVLAGSRARMGGRVGVWRAVRRFAAEFQPDIIHTHLLAGDYFGYLLCRRYRWISTLHNVEHHTSWLRRWLWRLILPRATRVIAVSPVVRAYASDHFGVASDRLILLTNGIDISAWSGVSQEDFFRADHLRLAVVGRLTEQKGHEYLLRALSLIDGVNWTLDIFGDGELRDSLRKLSVDLGIDSRVRFHGAVTDLYARLASIDVVVAPSLWEGMSLAVMECMAAGRAVVATFAAGEGLIRSGDDGLLVPSRNPAALADAIKYLYAHPEIGVSMGQSARSHALTYFDIQKNIEGLKQIYLN